MSPAASISRRCCELTDRSSACVATSAPEGYLDKFPMTEAQRNMILERDFLGMLRVGGNIYYTWKLAAFDRVSMQAAGAAMSGTGMTEQEFRDMMMNGGRPIKGNRYVGREDV